MTREERVQYQLEKWAAGESIHNEVDNECCPDFSCCNPSIAASIEIREDFLNAGEDERSEMLFRFLARMIESMGSTVTSSMDVDKLIGVDESEGIIPA